MSRVARAVGAARAVAAAHGLRTDDVRVLHDGANVVVDLAPAPVVARVATGNEPRSAALAADGANLFVVNYESASVSKIRTSDMTVVQTVGTATHPIGITYDDETRELWVACYIGRILLFRN